MAKKKNDLISSDEAQINNNQDNDLENKIEEIEKNNELLENQKKELENKYGIPKDSLKERIKILRKK